jgi:hypothetical protein
VEYKQKEIYRDIFKAIDKFTPLRFTSREVHANFADDSACLTADKVWNEGK